MTNKTSFSVAAERKGTTYLFELADSTTNIATEYQVDSSGASHTCQTRGEAYVGPGALARTPTPNAQCRPTGITKQARRPLLGGFCCPSLLCHNALSATFLSWQGIEVVAADSADSPPRYGWPSVRPVS